MKRKQIAITFIVIIGLYATLVVFEALTKPKLTSPVTTPVATSQPTPVPLPALRQDPELVVIMQRLGLDYSKLKLIYAPIPTPGLVGYYERSTLYLSPDHIPAEADRIIAHEYMHYVQDTNYLEAAQFHPYLQTLYESDTWLYNRLAYYRTGTCSDCRIVLEVQATACTEMPDASLEQRFVDWCNKWLPKRSNLL